MEIIKFTEIKFIENCESKNGKLKVCISNASNEISVFRVAVDCF